MKRTIAVWTAVLICASMVFAQAPAGPPKPGPEHKRLGYFVGNWHMEGDAKQSPLGPAGKITTDDHNEWFPGGFFVVSHSDAKGPMGEGKTMMILGWNGQEKVYTWHAVNSMGMDISAKGTVEGDTWTLSMGEGPMKARFVIKEVSATSCTLKLESSMGDGPWETILEAKGTKVK